MIVNIPVNGVILEGELVIPRGALGIVIFAHGSGSSRFSPRNRSVAAELQREKIATLLLDLLTPEEDRIDEITARLRFDIELLAQRLFRVAAWLRNQEDTKHLSQGYFGASTGGGAGLVAASRDPEIRAVVSRGGRPDLAGESLSRVRAPTLLIVGGRDDVVIELNRQAMERLNCVKKLEIVPHATHLFEERGALEEVARLAVAWFTCYLKKQSVSS